MGTTGSPGASLRMWRDYFPNARVVGVDIDPKTMFSEPRIETAVMDQLNRSSVEEVFNKLNRKFDIIIDDGLHTLEAAKSFSSVALNYLESDGLYIVEDIWHSHVDMYAEWAESTGKIYDIVEFEPSPNKTHVLVFRNI
jgi:23S rRNA U2552 (ribose-2'-O)-methylase RlmE/FtsJ